MKDKDGNDVEAFTEDEVKAREALALEQYQKDHPDQTEALTKSQTDLKTAQDALKAAEDAGGSDKDKNFAALRKQVADATAATETVRKEALAAIETAKNVPTQEYKTEIEDLLSGKDKELKEKIQIRYKELAGMPEGNKKEVRARMEAAFQLAAGRTAATILDGGVTSAAARGAGGLPEAGGTESENSRAQRIALGITDEQAKKFAPKEGQPGYQA